MFDSPGLSSLSVASMEVKAIWDTKPAYGGQLPLESGKPTVDFIRDRNKLLSCTLGDCFLVQHNSTYPDINDEENYKIDTRRALMLFNRTLTLAETRPGPRRGETVQLSLKKLSGTNEPTPYSPSGCSVHQSVPLYDTRGLVREFVHQWGPSA